MTEHHEVHCVRARMPIGRHISRGIGSPCQATSAAWRRVEPMRGPAPYKSYQPKPKTKPDTRRPSLRCFAA
jgi:hypothetical protein